MKKLITITTVAVVVGLLLAINYNPNSSGANAETNSDIKVSVDETSYDWGEINMNDGNVEKSFSIINTGTETLKLRDVVTSCMCTTAILGLGEVVSPTFGMHSKSNYVLEVPVGQTAELKVIFDPAFHGPSGIGPINRQVTVNTNSSETPKLTFMLTAMVRK